MQIVETNLDFSSLRERLSTNRIILHHSAFDTGDAKTIHGWHKNKGWAGIGYHFVINLDGTVERGRPANKIGAHAQSANKDSIGICLIGNFEKYLPKHKQLESLLWLVSYLRGYYKKRIAGIGSQRCYGNRLPWGQISLG